MCGQRLIVLKLAVNGKKCALRYSNDGSGLTINIYSRPITHVIVSEIVCLSDVNIVLSDILKARVAQLRHCNLVLYRTFDGFSFSVRIRDVQL